MRSLSRLAALSLVLPLLSSGSSGLAQTALARLPAPAVSLAALRAGSSDELYALSTAGELWSLADPKCPERLAAGLSPDAGLSTCDGRLLAVAVSGQLYWGGLTSVQTLSPFASPTCAPDGGVLVISAVGELLRVTKGGAVAQRLLIQALPDARPRLADLRGDGKPLVVVLAAPSGRYLHGILGDSLEAASLLALDPQTLKVEARLDLPAPFAFEDLEARPLSAQGREVLALVRSGPQGGAALVVAGFRASQGSAAQLSLLAIGPDFGQPQRWLAPITDGHDLYAVHTPHIGGTLNSYSWMGNRLKAVLIKAMPPVSNHRIGTRTITGGVWKGVVWAGSQDGQQTLNTGGFPALSASPSSPLFRTASSGYLALRDGTVVKLP